MKMGFLVGRTKEKPLSGGHDHVLTSKAGGKEVETALELLPLDDPLYTATISLGDRRRILGVWESWYAAGPPGIDYYTFPELKNLADLMAFWYIDPADDQCFQLLQDCISSFSNYDLTPVLAHQKEKLFRAILPLIKE